MRKTVIGIAVVVILSVMYCLTGTGLAGNKDDVILLTDCFLRGRLNPIYDRKLTGLESVIISEKEPILNKIYGTLLAQIDNLTISNDDWKKVTIRRDIGYGAVMLNLRKLYDILGREKYARLVALLQDFDCGKAGKSGPFFCYAYTDPKSGKRVGMYKIESVFFSWLPDDVNSAPTNAPRQIIGYLVAEHKAPMHKWKLRMETVTGERWNPDFWPPIKIRAFAAICNFDLQTLDQIITDYEPAFQNARIYARRIRKYELEGVID